MQIERWNPMRMQDLNRKTGSVCAMSVASPLAIRFLLFLRGVRTRCRHVWFFHAIYLHILSLHLFQTQYSASAEKNSGKSCFASLLCFVSSRFCAGFCLWVAAFIGAAFRCSACAIVYLTIFMFLFLVVSKIVVSCHVELSRSLFIYFFLFFLHPFFFVVFFGELVWRILFRGTFLWCECKTFL